MPEVTYELLEQKAGAYTYFVTTRSRPGLHRPLLLSKIAGGGYLSVPFEVKDGKLKVTFLGDAKEMKSILTSLERSNMHYKVISLSDTRFSSDSPMARLTRKQRDVLTNAYSLGYYDRPRRITSEKLARKLNLAKSTLVAHRRKAERRLLAALLSES